MPLAGYWDLGLPRTGTWLSGHPDGPDAYRRCVRMKMEDDGMSEEDAMDVCSQEADALGAESFIEEYKSAKFLGYTYAQPPDPWDNPRFWAEVFDACVEAMLPEFGDDERLATESCVQQQQDEAAFIEHYGGAAGRFWGARLARGSEKAIDDVLEECRELCGDDETCLDLCVAGAMWDEAVGGSAPLLAGKQYNRVDYLVQMMLAGADDFTLSAIEDALRDAAQSLTDYYSEIEDVTVQQHHAYKSAKSAAKGWPPPGYSRDQLIEHGRAMFHRTALAAGYHWVLNSYAEQEFAEIFADEGEDVAVAWLDDYAKDPDQKDWLGPITDCASALAASLAIDLHVAEGICGKQDECDEAWDRLHGEETWSEGVIADWMTACEEGGVPFAETVTDYYIRAAPTDRGKVTRGVGAVEYLDDCVDLWLEIGGDIYFVDLEPEWLLMCLFGGKDLAGTELLLSIENFILGVPFEGSWVTQARARELEWLDDYDEPTCPNDGNPLVLRHYGDLLYWVCEEEGIGWPV